MPIISEEQVRDMQALEEAINQVLRRAKTENLEAAIAVLALCRCARTLLDMYPQNTKAALLTAIKPFLEGVGEVNISDLYLH